MLTIADILAAPKFERITTMTPLGIRFWDATRDAQITGGLRVTARPRGVPEFPETSAFITASGIYAFAGLPGLQAFERPKVGDPDPDFAAPIASGSFWIDVTDPAGHFIDVTFTATAPAKGLFLAGDPQPTGQPPPNTSPPGFYLFSSPSRQPGAGIAAIRADLIDNATKKPAAYAVVMVKSGTNTQMIGIADAAGRVAVMFPFPVVSRGTQSGVVPPPQWPLNVSVQYAPTNLAMVPAAAVSPTTPLGSPRPELSSVLNQAAGVIFAATNAASVATLPVTLTGYSELILKSQGQSELFIQSA